MSTSRREVAIGDIAVGLGAVLGLVASVLPWFSFRTVNCSTAAAGVCTTSDTAGPNGFVGWAFLCLLAVVATLALFVLRTFLTAVEVPSLPWPDWKIYMGLGGVMVVAIVLDFLFTPQYTHLKPPYTTSEGWSTGIVLALIAAILVIAGGRLDRPAD